MNQSYDVVVIGAGIVGLTVAAELLRREPALKIAILEKEASIGLHASGRNSGVLHCGIFYGSDTLKAKVCSEGARRMLEFAERENIKFTKCGKIILATDEAQLPTVNKLQQNALDNNIIAHRLTTQEFLEIEPFAAPGPAALYCPTTAVIDGPAVLSRLISKLVQAGVDIYYCCKFKRYLGNKLIETTAGKFEYQKLINCAGAYADTIAKSFDLGKEYVLVPFKGIYWKLTNQANYKIKANIYPVPDVAIPFLGVHFTRGISGDVYIGPTAIPAFGRENYGVLSGINSFEAIPIIIQLSKMYLTDEQHFRRTAHVELSKYFKQNFMNTAKKLVPTLSTEEMDRTPKAGIRPQLVNIKNNRLEMDYILLTREDSLHVLNAISPAFTSSLAFAELIVDQAFHSNIDHQLLPDYA